MVRIADLDDIGVQLSQGLGLGLGAHPVQRRDAGVEGALQVRHQRLHLGLRAGREIVLGVELADPPAQVAEPVQPIARQVVAAAHRAHRPLPPRPRLGLARQRPVAHLETRRGEGRGQVGGGVVGHLERHPGLQRPQGCLGIDRRQFRKGALLAHDHLAADATLHVSLAQPGLPRKPRRQGLQPADGHGVVGLLRIPLLSLAPAGLGDLGLQGRDLRRPRGRFRPARQLQQRLHIGLVLRLLRRERGVQVVVPVRQSQPRLVDEHRIARRNLGIGVDPHLEQAAIEVGVGLAHQRAQRLAVLGLPDRRQFRGDGRCAQGLDAALVHERLVEGARLALHRGRLGHRVRRRVLEQAVHAGLHPIGHRQPQADPRLVGRNLRLGQPSAVGVSEEAVAGPHGGVFPRRVEPPGAIVQLVRRAQGPGPGQQRHGQRRR